MYAYAPQNVSTGEWIFGLVGEGMEDEVLVSTTFTGMEQTLAGLGVRSTGPWVLWGDDLRASVDNVS